MTFVASLLLLCVQPHTAIRCIEPPRQAQDAWVAPDKLRHFAGAYAVTAFTHAVVRSVTDDDGATLALAAAAGVAASIGKEWLDARRGGAASLRDLVWDAAGIAAALLLMREMQ